MDRLRRLLASPRGPGLLAAVAFTLVSLAVYAVTPQAWNPSSDGHYSWLYARSLAYDGDLDFQNDYAKCGDPFAQGFLTDAGRPANIFYPGPAVVWTPIAFVLRFVIGLFDVRESFRLGCTGLVPNVALATSSLLGGLVVYLSWAMLRGRVRPWPAAAAAFVVGVGSHLFYFTALSPSYSHVHDACAVTALIAAVWAKPARLRGWLGIGALLGLALLQRASNVIFFVVPLVTLIELREDRIRRLGSVLVGAGVVGVFPLLLSYRLVWGHWLTFTHGRHFMHFGHAHPLLLLFDQRGGLFLFAPVLWISVLGIALVVRKPWARTTVVPLVGLLACETWIASAALDWQGARRLLNLTPLFVLGAAVVFERIELWIRAHPRQTITAGIGAVCLHVAWTHGAIVYAFGNGKMGYDKPYGEGELYDGSERAADDAIERRIGAPSVAPAAVVFALRYRLPPRAFGAAANPMWFSRDPRTLAYGGYGFNFAFAGTEEHVRGFRPEDDGTWSVRDHGTLVFAAQWPKATRAVLIGHAKTRATVRIASRTFWGARTEWGAVVIDGEGEQRETLAIPEGGFDSGLNELVFEVDAPVSVRGLEIYDDSPYLSAY